MYGKETELKPTSLPVTPAKKGAVVTLSHLLGPSPPTDSKITSPKPASSASNTVSRHTATNDSTVIDVDSPNVPPIASSSVPPIAEPLTAFMSSSGSTLLAGPSSGSVTSSVSVLNDTNDCTMTGNEYIEHMQAISKQLQVLEGLKQVANQAGTQPG